MKRTFPLIFSLFLSSVMLHANPSEVEEAFLSEEIASSSVEEAEPLAQEDFLAEAAEDEAIAQETEEELFETFLKENEQAPSDVAEAVPSVQLIHSEPIVAKMEEKTSSAFEERVEAPALVAAKETQLLPPPAVLKQKKATGSIQINMHQVFSGSPVIYSILLLMSMAALFLWLYTVLSLRDSGKVSDAFQTNLRNKLNSNQFEDALDLCTQGDSLFCRMMACGIASRGHGLPLMLETMKAEGKRLSARFWQRLGLLNDIAIIAPMLGLLGTVLGMFYAFYDVNRSIESVSTLFDGLGISVGTTVAGLIVSIIAMILHSLAKFRLVRVLSHVENEAQTLAAVIDDRTSLYTKS